MKRFVAIFIIFLSGLLLFASDFPLVSMSELYDQNPDINNCYEGKLKESEKQKVMQYLNYIRGLHNIKPVQYASSFDNETAKSALITVANALLDHFPKSSYLCYTQDGYNGSSTSNLYVSGGASPDFMPPSDKGMMSWIIDLNVETLGHRRNLLNPFLKYTSFGRVDGYSKAQPNLFLTGMSIKVHNFPDYHNLADWNQDFVAYPFNDYPSALVDLNWYLSFTVVADKSNIWNNSNNTVDYSQATVKVTDPNNNQLTITNLKYDYQGYGVPNCIYWKTSGLQKDVKYTVTISNVKVNGTPKTFTYWFRVTDNPPVSSLQPPTLLAPPDNATDIEPPVTLSWSNVSDAQYYALQVSSNSDFSNPIVDLKNITTNTYTVSQLNPGIKYYWRVAAIKGNLTSNWSPTFSFTTKNIPLTAPIALAPLNGETNVELNPTFIWGKVQQAEKYHLQVCIDDSFDDFALIINQNDIKDTIYKSPVKFYANSIYYWRVRAIKLTSYGPWSEVKTFWTLNPSSVENDNNLRNKYILIDEPNKANILLEDLQINSVTLYNLYGKKAILLQHNQNANFIEIPYENLSSGLWLLEVKTNNKIYFIYLLIIK
ncbi:MAG: fibronectin type III domain-containing protein [Candidatus Kapaibacteriota bacterium]